MHVRSSESCLPSTLMRKQLAVKNSRIGLNIVNLVQWCRLADNAQLYYCVVHGTFERSGVLAHARKILFA